MYEAPCRILHPLRSLQTEEMPPQQRLDESQWTPVAYGRTDVLNPLPSALCLNIAQPMTEDVTCDLPNTHPVKRFLTTIKSQSSFPLPRFQLNPSPIPKAWGHKPTGGNDQLVGRGKVAGLSTELLVNTPERRASFTTFVNHQQYSRWRARQLKVFKRRDSDYHRVLNHHSTHPLNPKHRTTQECMSMGAHTPCSSWRRRAR